MKLIISAQGPAAGDQVDPRFGRAPFFVLFDTETGEFTGLDNSDQTSAQQGAGVQAAQAAVASGATVLLTGRCGPKAFAALSAADFKVYSGIQGTVLDAVRDWRDGRLDQLTAPDGIPTH